MENFDNAPFIVDEAQRDKKRALAIKGMVDTDRRKGQFVLTGSSNVFTTTDVADLLAGRMRTLKLLPLSTAEIMPVRKPDALRILIDQMASRKAQEINTFEQSKLVNLQRVTVDQYLDILVRLSMVTELSAWTPGESKREVKQPKYHFVDVGID